MLRRRGARNGTPRKAVEGSKLEELEEPELASEGRH